MIDCVKLLNDSQIVSCSYDKTIKIWELATDDCIKTLLGHSDYVFCIANNRIASYCIWDVESGDCVKILNG